MDKWRSGGEHHSLEVGQYPVGLVASFIAVDHKEPDSSPGPSQNSCVFNQEILSRSQKLESW